MPIKVTGFQDSDASRKPCTYTGLSTLREVANKPPKRRWLKLKVPETGDSEGRKRFTKV